MPSSTRNTHSSKVIQPASRLHIDILEQKYGPITTKVLRHDYRIREAHLMDKNGISRTFAVSLFPSTYPLGELDIVGAKTRRGKSIGVALHEHGFSVRRNILLIDLMEVPRWLQSAFHHNASPVKFRLSEFLVKKLNIDVTLYATVLEVFPANFQKPVTTVQDKKLFNAPLRDLENAGISGLKVWEVLGNDNAWGDLEERAHEVYEQSATSVTKTYNEMRTILALRRA